MMVYFIVNLLILKFKIFLLVNVNNDLSILLRIGL